MKTTGKSLYRNAIHGALTVSTKKLLALTIAAAIPVGAEADIGEIQEIKVEGQAQPYRRDKSISYKRTQQLLDTAKTITVIPQTLLEHRGTENVRDAVRSIPGITLAAGEGGTPTGDSLSIRGFSARTDIMIDNVRDIAGYTRDVYNLEAIEVAKGPGSAVSGRGATGGSINLQTKTADLKNASHLGLSSGDANDYRATFDSNKVFGDTTALRVNLLADDGEVAGRDEVYNAKQAGAISLATGLETASRLSLSADYQEQDNLPDYGLPWVSAGQASYVDALAASAGGAPAVDQSNFYGNLLRDFEEIKAQSLTLQYEYDLSTHTSLRTQARVGSVERLSIVSAPRFIDIANSTDVRLSDEKTRDTKNALSLIQFDLIGRYQFGTISHDLVAGVELSREKEKRWNLDDNGTDNLDTTPLTVDLYNPDSRLAYTGIYSRDGTSTEAIGDTQALYIFDTLTFNSAWQLTLGARWDSFDTEYQFSYSDPTEVLKASDKLFSWNTAMVYKPTANSSIYLGIGNSFNPSAEDLTASTRGNVSDLDPEETLSYELGSKWDLLAGKLLVTGAIFRTEKTNARTDAPDGAFAEDDGRFVRLNGEQRVDGLELSATGQLSDKLMLMAAYTYQDSEVIRAEGGHIAQIGNPLARTPEHSASFWASYLFGDDWRAGLGAQYSSERYNSSDSITREVADSYTTVDMMVAYDVSENIKLQLNGSNLGDKKYINQLGGGHFIPGERRHFRLSGHYLF